MNKLSLYLPRGIGLVLILTALLKLLLFFQTPLSKVQADPGMVFLTMREVLLLSSIFEIGVAYFLLRSVDPTYAGWLILYFCACASMYQISLVFQTEEKVCSCLGVATNLLGHGTATWLARAILVIFWTSGFILLRSSRRRVNFRQPVTAVWFFLLGLISNMAVEGKADQVSVTGELVSSFDYNGKSKAETKTFQATFDENALLLTYVPRSPPSKYNVPPLSNLVFMSKEYAAICSRTSGPEDVAVVSLKQPEYLWQLGNCPGDGLASRVFLVIRCLEIFSETGASSTRPLATPSTIGGAPLSLITLAHYQFSENRELLTCELRVDDRLRQKWRSAPLLNPSFRAKRGTDDLLAAQAKLALYWDGCLTERIEFSGFTNRAGIRFPTFAEFTKYSVSRKTGGNAAKEVITGKATLILSVLEQSAAGPVTFSGLVTAKPITVADERLTDRSFHIDGVTFETNALTSLEISPIARAKFAHALEAARKAGLSARIRKGVSVGLLVILLISPLIAIKWIRGRSGHSVRDLAT